MTTELALQFGDLVEAARDGLGSAFEGTRANLRVLVRLFPNERADRLGEEVKERATRFHHPVLLELESGAAEDSVWLSAPVLGTPIAALGAVLPPNQCIDVALALVELVVAARRAGTAIGPLLPTNVYVDPTRPGWVRVFPLNRVSWGTADWLDQPADHLLYVDRQTLRQRPDDTGALFSIAVLALVLAKGAAALSTPSLSTPSTTEPTAALIRRIIEQRHPLAGGIERTGPLEALLGEVVAGSLANPTAAFRDRLLGLRASYDPIARALAMRDGGNALQAIAVLHRAIKDGERSPRTYLLKARLEVEQGHPARAIQSLREARSHAPQSRAILERLAELTQDPEEARDALRTAVRLCPTDATLRMALVEAALACGDHAAAFELLAVVQTIAYADPSEELIWPRIAKFLLGAGMPHDAIRLAEPHAGSAVEADVRAEALVVIGRAQYALHQFEPAAKALREALAALAEQAIDPPIVVLNELAFALIASNRQGEAVEIAMRSLVIDPAQPQILAFLEAVS